MKEFDWEFFEDGQAHGTGNSIHVTINKRCMIFFNKHAVAALGAPEGVSLMYDRRRSTIGVTATPLNRLSSYRLRPKEGVRPKDGRCSGSFMISAKNFCRRFRISPTEPLAFTTAKVNNDGILLLDLNEVRSVAKS